MVKNADGYLLKGSLNRKFIVKLRPFLSWKHRICQIILNPRKRASILIFVLHVGTNDLRLSDTPEQIAEHIFDIVNSLKTDSNTIIVSNIVPRGDKNKEKTEKALQIINNACVQRSVPVINHTNVN